MTDTIFEKNGFDVHYTAAGHQGGIWLHFGGAVVCKCSPDHTNLLYIYLLSHPPT